MSIFKRSDGRSGNYYFYVRHRSGKASKRSTGTRDKRLAEKVRAKYILEALQDKALDREPDRSFKELIVIYLEAKQEAGGLIAFGMRLSPFFRPSETTMFKT